MRVPKIEEDKISCRFCNEDLTELTNEELNNHKCIVQRRDDIDREMEI